jgi:phage baseplate assembly protein W
MAIDITNQSKQVATSKHAYSDLDLLFRTHPQTGDVVVRTDADAVKRSVRNIILTNHYERPFKPGFGASIRELLFELNTSRQLRKAQNRIKRLIETFEPRVHEVNVRLQDTDTNEIQLGVYYSIKNGIAKQSMEMTLTRAR